MIQVTPSLGPSLEAAQASSKPLRMPTRPSIPSRKILTFRAYRCKAEPGQPCWWSGRQRPGRIDFRDLLNPQYHVARQERRAKAANRRITAAIIAGEAAERRAERRARR